MGKTAKSVKLKPEEIVRIKMDSGRIVHVDYLCPIQDADMDYKVALYVDEEVKKIEKSCDKYVGLLIDISNYNRLDGTEFFNLTVPSMQARELHSRIYKEQKIRRVAFCKKNAHRLAKMYIKMAAIYHGKKVRLFSDSEKAKKWLKEGMK